MEEKKEPKKIDKNLIIILILSLIIVVLIALLAWGFVQNNNDKSNLEKKYNELLNKVEDDVDDIDDVQEDASEGDSEGDLVEDVVEDEEESSETNEEVDENIADSDLIKVAWLSVPEKSEKEKNSVTVSDYKLGTITSGQYEGGEVRMEIYTELGVIYNRYILHNGQEIITEENNIKIEGIDDVPERITYPDSGVELKKGYIGADLFSSENKLILGAVSFTVDGRDYYKTSEGCFVTKLADGTLMPYDMKLPFINTDTNEVDLTINGTKLTDSYVYEKITGCGVFCTLLKDQAVTDEELIEAGYASNQDKIYKLVNNNHALLSEIYNDKNTLPYYDESNNKTETNKYTYDEFLALNPLLFWKDPLGNWIELKNSKLIIAAEMCKPVVYLYPEKETKLEVKVSPNGGFTYTEPEYNGAWNVQASPSGEIVDLKTGAEYEYLFWEGIGLNLGEMDKGFIVERSGVEEFLNEKLSILGLNDKEISDFNEYWVDRLNDGEYYKISFVDQRVFDKVAPLEISPSLPDNIIRVFMVAKEVEKPYDLEEQKLYKRSSRDGFSVVEWGGALLK